MNSNSLDSKSSLTLLFRALLQSSTTPAPSRREPSFYPLFANRNEFCRKLIIVNIQSYDTLHLKKKRKFNVRER